MNAPQPVVGCTGMRTRGVPDTGSRWRPPECSVSPTDGKYPCKTLRNRMITYSSVLLQCYLKVFKLHNNNNIQRYLQKINLSDPENGEKKGFFSSFAGRFRRFLRVDRKKIHDATRWLSARWCGGTKNNWKKILAVWKKVVSLHPLSRKTPPVGSWPGNERT